MKTVIKNVKDLKVYQMAYKLAVEIFEITNQIRRSSRSVAINIREGFAKRKYEQMFIRPLNDALGSSEETRGWVEFSLECRYISKEKHKQLYGQYDEVNAMMYSLIHNWQNFSDF